MSEPAKKHEAATTTLLVHSVLVGLTPLIPIPILDDAVKEHVERRLVTDLSAPHGYQFDAKDLSVLAGIEDSHILKSIAVGVVTFPLKLIFRKLFVVLEVKRASDEASRCFHRGWLLDHAFAARVVAPLGPRTPAEVRAALDAACQAVPVSPLGTVFHAVLDGSKDLLGGALKHLIGGLKPKSSAPTEGDVAKAVEDAAGKGSPIAPIVERLRKAIAELPSEHFVALEAAFESALGASLRSRPPHS